jgi:glycosyltransferase involved in cell wall biosynthesis
MAVDQKALVSVCIPTYNGAKYLLEALESVRIQTYTNIELIISDDNSEDDTLAIINRFKKSVNFPVYIFKNATNGIGENWNNCIKCAHGTFIKFLFQDDVLEKDCIGEMIKIYDIYPEIGLVASKRSFIVDENSKNETITKWISRYGNLQKSIRDSDNEILILDKYFFKDNCFTASPPNKIGEPTTVLFRRSIVEVVGYFRTDLKQVLDYEFWYRILREKKIAIINKELVKFRIHQDQATNVNRGNDIQDYIIYDKLLFKKYFFLLNFETRKKLFKKHSLIFKVLRKFRALVKNKQ